MSPDTKVPPPSSYCYAIRLSNRRTKDATVNKCPIALDRRKKPNSALHPRDTSGNYFRQDKWTELSAGRATDAKVQASTQEPTHLFWGVLTSQSGLRSSLRLLGKAFPRVPVPTPTKRHTRRRQSQTQAKKDALMTEPTPIRTLEEFHATRIRLAQKSLSITLPLS